MGMYERTERLLGKTAMQTLASCRIAVFGIGGVGGAAAEALARCGVGALDLIDDDLVSESNLNRQMMALHSTVGEAKTEAAHNRLADISPMLRLTTHPMFYLPKTADALDVTDFDYIIDAMDTVTAKITLIENAKREKVPIISCMGTGNRLDPSALRTGDLFATAGDPLARVMRRELRKRGIRALTVVYSTEPPTNPSPPKEEPLSPVETRPVGHIRRDTPASAPFVPPAAGFLAASYAVRQLISGAVPSVERKRSADQL